MPPIGQREITSNGLVMPNARGDEQDDIANWLALDQMISGTHPSVKLARLNAQNQIVTPDGGVVGGAGGTFIDARYYGVLPGLSTSIRSQLSTALNAAAAAGKWLLVQAGEYIYDGTISVTGGGGMVCLNGRALFSAQHPDYDQNLISFTQPAGALYDGFRLENIDFDNTTMPSTGLSNDADENAGFIRLTNIRNVYVANNRVLKNYGGFLLLRNVVDAVIERNVCRDLWKDVFHTTDTSRNITRRLNVVINCGDDAFATVGYLYRGVRPEFIYDYGNYVYACRRGRAFAYVGAAHVRNANNFVDGRPINPYQALSPNGHSYRGNCALYIGSEYEGQGSTYNTYGCHDVEAYVDAQYMGPIVTTPGGGGVSQAIEPINSYGAVHIYEVTSAGDDAKHSNIKIRGTLKNLAKKPIYVYGSEGLDIEMQVINNTDPDGWVGVAGAYSQPGVEAQAIRGKNRIHVDVKTCNTAPAIIGDACRGDLDLRVKMNDVLKTTVHDGASWQPGGILDTLNLEIDLDWDVPAGRVDVLADLAGSANEVNLKFGGKGSADNIALLVSGAASSRAITLTGSPQILVNTGDDDLYLQIRGGTVSQVEQARILAHHGRPVASVAGNVLTIAGDVSTSYTTSRHAVFLSQGASFEMTQVIAITNVSFSGGNTSVTLASAPPATGTYSRVAPLHTDNFTVNPGNVRRFIKLAKNRALRVTYSVAPTITAIASKQ